MSADHGKRETSFILNGERRTVRALPMERLLDVLRRELNLTGTKEGCGEGECGACAVLMDGVLVNSCLVPAGQAEGTSVMTIEGASADPAFSVLRDAFIECGGAQCGICTPGMILASMHLLQKTPNPTWQEIREGLSGNICRCTGYQQIFESVAEAARRRASA
jgi:aerobic carbon-monoxide dehydrogenase small subunit